MCMYRVIPVIFRFGNIFLFFSMESNMRDKHISLQIKNVLLTIKDDKKINK